MLAEGDLVFVIDGVILVLGLHSGADVADGVDFITCPGDTDTLGIAPEETVGDLGKRGSDACGVITVDRVVDGVVLAPVTAVGIAVVTLVASTDEGGCGVVGLILLTAGDGVDETLASVDMTLEIVIEDCAAFSFDVEVMVTSGESALTAEAFPDAGVAAASEVFGLPVIVEAIFGCEDPILVDGAENAGVSPVLETRPAFVTAVVETE